MDAQNYLYSNFAGLRFVGTQKIVGTQICWYSYSKNFDTQILGHYHLWVLKICGYSKVAMIQNSSKVAGNIRTYMYVFSAYHVNRKTYVLFHICFLPYVQKHTM